MRDHLRALRGPVAALVVALGLGACGNWVDARRAGLDVVNNTDQSVTVRHRERQRGEVLPGTTKELVFGIGCRGDEVDAITEDGTLVAYPTGDLCDGDTWTIEQSDLVPAPEPTPSPTSPTSSSTS